MGQSQEEAVQRFLGLRTHKAILVAIINESVLSGMGLFSVIARIGWRRSRTEKSKRILFEFWHKIQSK